MATVYKRGGRNQRGGRYYISYFDHNGHRVSRSARTTDKATAERIAAGGVSWGYASPELLRAHRPTVMFESFDDVLRVLVGGGPAALP